MASSGFILFHSLPFLLQPIVFHGRPVIKLDNFFSMIHFYLSGLYTDYHFSFHNYIQHYCICPDKTARAECKGTVLLYISTYNLSWLKVISIGFYVTYILVFIVGVYLYLKRNCPMIPLLFPISDSLSLHLLHSYGIKQPGIFNELYDERKNKNSEN